MIDILMDSRSPTQHRGEPKLSGGTIYDEVTNAWGRQFRIRIDYTLSGDMVTDLGYEVSGEHDFDLKVLRDIVEEIVEQTEGHTLIFE